jgi:ribA/ribD-fused uncharacterized protein
MYTDYIKLEKIREEFKDYFKSFSIELPEPIKTWDEIEGNSGWLIIHSLGYDDNKIPCIYFSANHRLTNPSHFLINENGEYKSLDFYQERVAYNPAIEGDEEVKRQEYYKHNRRVGAIHRLNGVDSNFEYNSLSKSEYFKNYKEFHFFWESNSPFSQWHECSFIAFGLTFNTAEQYMMYEKALLFEDYNTASKLLTTTNPRQQKELGRQVINFDDIIWKENCRRIVYEANKLKFLQNENLLVELMNTDDKLLVEASPYDTIWGIGLKADDERAQNLQTWQGTNWLGFILTSLRNDIKLKIDK